MKEARFLLFVILLVCVLSSLPYIYGYLSAPPDRVFMGIVLNTPDTTEYFAWMRGFGTANLIDNKLTPEPNGAVFFNLLWWTLGRLARWGGLSLTLVYQLFRIATAVAFLLLAYWFCGLFLPERGQRRTAFLLIALGSGLGWIWVVLKYLSAAADIVYPFDVYTVEPNTFLGITAFPHFVQAAFLILIIFALALSAFERKADGAERLVLRDAVLAGLAALLLGLTHAYDLLLIYAVVGVYALVLLWRDGFSYRLMLVPAVIVALSVGPAIYSVYLTSAFPLWREVLAQFANAGAWTPNPLHLPVLLGVPFLVGLLFVVGALSLKRRTEVQATNDSRRELFLKTWFVVNLFVVYVPLNYQIHYLNGWQVPIAILATMGFYRRVIPWLRGRSGPGSQGRLALIRRALKSEAVLAILLVVAALPTNVYLLAWRFVDLSRHSHPYYLARDEWEALRWLDANAPPGAVVLSSMDIGQYVPSMTGGRAFLAHWAMTADLYRKQDMVQAFFDSQVDDTERAHILQAYNVRYIFWGEAERKLGPLDPDKLPFAERVFSSSQAVVYQVKELSADSVHVLTRGDGDGEGQ